MFAESEKKIALAHESSSVCSSRKEELERI
jgi:hypothetical protein